MEPLVEKETATVQVDEDECSSKRRRTLSCMQQSSPGSSEEAAQARPIAVARTGRKLPFDDQLRVIFLCTIITSNRGNLRCVARALQLMLQIN